MDRTHRKLECILSLAGLLLASLVTARADVCVWTGGWDITPDADDDTIVIRDGADLPWPATLPATVASWTQEGSFSNTVTFETVYGASGFTNFTITGSCILSNGTWRHLGNTTDQENRLRVHVGGDFTLHTNASITVTSDGYSPREGPGQPVGASAGLAGGAYGGGGNRSDALPYGSVTNPVDLGSGGWSSPGGGAVYLTVDGASTLDGEVRADGGASVNRTGAGGSVYFRSGTLAGSGNITANGGENSGQGQGSGGRIAIVLTNSGAAFGGFTGAMQARTGATSKSGAAGTVYRQTGDGAKTLVVDNAGRNAPYGTWTSAGTTAFDYGILDEIIVTNGGRLAIESDDSIDLATAGLVRPWVLSIVSTNGLTIPSSYVLTNATLIAETATGFESLTVDDAGTLDLGGDVTAGSLLVTNGGQVVSYPYTLTVSGDLTVASDASINANGRGVNGPGYATSSTTRDGGSYGGRGGDAVPAGTGHPGPCYGSFLKPSHDGSDGSTGSGGGVVRLAVGGVARIEGTVSADGAYSSIGGSGSGGSVLLQTGELMGEGTIRANGGGKDYNARGTGGGGRVSVALTNAAADFTSFSGTIEARAVSGGTAVSGAGGSVYKATAEQGYESGTVWIAPGSYSTLATLELPPSYDGSDSSYPFPAYAFTDDLSRVTFRLTNQAWVVLSTNTSIGDLFVAGDALLDLNSFTLTVNTDAHALDGTVSSNGGQLVWQPLTIAVSDTGVLEGDGGTATSAVFQVFLSVAMGTDVTFDYSTVNGTATAGDDFSGLSALPGTIAAGLLSTSIVVTVTGDDWVEDDETFSLVLANVSANVDVGDGTGVCTITNDDTRTLSIADTSVNEGPAGNTTNAFLTVTLSEPISTDVTFSYYTTNGSAVAPGDYTATNGSLTIVSGQTQTGIVVSVSGDDDNEGAGEAFYVVLHGISPNAAAGTSTGTCQIVDDDGVPSLSIADTSVAEGDQGTTTNAAFILTLSATSGSDVTFDLNTADGTALAPSDYTAVSTSGLIAAGQLSTTVTVNVNGDYAVEGNETFEMVVSNPGGAALLVATGTCMIINDDYPFVWTGAGGSGLASDTNNWLRGAGVSAIVPGGDAHVVLDATSSSNLTWDAGVAGLSSAIMSWTQTEDYSGTVTIATVYPGEGAFTNFAIAGSCTVSNGTWRHHDNGSDQTYRLCVTVSGDFALAPNGTVDVTGLGYDVYSGPGQPAGGSVGLAGGAYGGMAGKSDALPYGSVTHPVDLGSGAASSTGGGAIHIGVAGSITVDGDIKADGGAGANRTGAGGSVYLEADAISGAGAITANGGENSGHGQGSGGRIAVVVTNTGAGFGSLTGTMEARTGAASVAGAAGTIYTRRGDGYEILVVDNGGRTADASLWTSAGTTAFDYGSLDEIIVTNGGRLAIEADDTIDLGTAGLVHPWVLTIVSTNGLTVPDPYTLTNATLALAGPTRLGETTVGSVGTLDLGAAVSAGSMLVTNGGQVVTDPYTLAVAGDLTVAAGSSVNADARGINGPGYATSATTRDGGSHGGRGGDSVPAGDGHPGPCYGSFLRPSHDGSRGSTGVGGGVVRLAVGGTTRVDGTISADSGYSSIGATGSGGSIQLKTGRITGGGVVRANADGMAYGGRGTGGGGRVSVVLTNAAADFSSFTGSIQARTLGDAVNGAGGSVYKGTAAEGYERGTVYVDFGGYTTTESVELPPSYDGSNSDYPFPAYRFTDALERVTFSLTNSAHVMLTTNATVGDLCIASDAFLTLSNHVLYINSLEHNLGDPSQRGPGATDRVDHYDQIIWTGHPAGTMFTIR